MSNVDKYRSAHQSFNRRDWTAVVQNFSPDAQYTDHARRVTLKSPQDLVDYLRANWVAAFSDAAITDIVYIDAGDHVIAQFTGTGTNDGAFGPMPRTGRRYPRHSARSCSSTRRARSSAEVSTMTRSRSSSSWVIWRSRRRPSRPVVDLVK